MKTGGRVSRVEDETAGPWTRWKGSRVGRFVRFTERYLRAPRGIGSRHPLKLLRWEKEFAEAVHAQDVSAVGLVMGRGGGKSTILAALAAEAGFQEDAMGAPVIPIIAVSLAQAKASVYSNVVSMVEHEPELATRSLVFSGIGTERITIPRTEGAIFPRAAEADALQGLDIYPFGIVDEWGHIPLAPWQAILMSRKRPGATVIGAGTPGPDTETPLYQVRKLLRDGGTLPAFRYIEYSGEPGADLRDEANWHRANPSLAHGFPDIEFLRSAVEMSPESFFRTYHLAEFDVAGHDSWLGTAARGIWRDGIDAWTFTPGARAWIGVDIGLYHDSSAVVTIQERPDGRLHAKAMVWVPTKDAMVDLPAVLQHVRDECERWDVEAVAYDKRHLEVEGINLANSGYPMVDIAQSVERMTPICADLAELIHGRQITHDDDPVFEAHVVNAVAQVNTRGYTLSKSRSKGRGRIDACIALALAANRARMKKPELAPLVVW